MNSLIRQRENTTIETYRKIIVGAVFLSFILVGCGRIPTSTCGAFISPEECEKKRKMTKNWIEQSCRKGELVNEVSENIKRNAPENLPTARWVCRYAYSGGDSYEILYLYIANNKCTSIEEGRLDIGRGANFFEMFTKLDDVTVEMSEGLRSLCNDFRSGRISGRDMLYNEAKLWRSYHREAMSTFGRGMLTILVWPIKSLVWLLGVIATVVGIIAAVQSIKQNTQKADQ